MRKLASLMFAVSQACGRLPLLAALALVLAARLMPLVRPERPPLPQPVQLEQYPADFEVILGVLERRAPDLGLTLRRQLAVAIAEEARRAGYDPVLIVAIIDVESDFEEDAVSEKGARGLMQIKPSTLHFLARSQGLRLSSEEVAADPSLCVRLGVRYLRALHDKFRDLDLALMAYNAGPARLRQAMRDGTVDFFRRYASLVQRDFRRLREREGLAGDWAMAQRAEVTQR